MKRTVIFCLAAVLVACGGEEKSNSVPVEGTPETPVENVQITVDQAKETFIAAKANIETDPQGSYTAMAEAAAIMGASRVNDVALGDLALRVDKPVEAVAYFKRAEQQLVASDGFRVRQSIMFRVATACAEAKDYSCAISYKKAEMSLAAKEGNTGRLAKNYGYLGYFFRDSGELEKSAESFQKSADLYVTMSDFGAASVSKNALAFVQRDLGSANLACASWRTAVVDANKSGRSDLANTITDTIDSNCN